jgi:hypothetical protein
MKMKTANGGSIPLLAKNLRRSGCKTTGGKESGSSALSAADQEIAAAWLR